MGEAEQNIIDLEKTFPSLSGVAFATAREEALRLGHSVWQSEDGVIYEVFPDGRRIERKRIEPPTPIPTGTKITIR